jgi:thioredoxin 1
MTVIKLNSENFEDTIFSAGIVIIDCWASWCSACTDFGPVFESAADRHPQHTFVSLDTQAQRELTESLGVTHIPTLVLLRDGVLLLRQPGYVAADGLDEIVAKAESLDMNRVRAELAEPAAATA